MIFAHTFQNYFLSDYNRHMTFFVIVGFVSLSGFTSSAVNAGKMAGRCQETGSRIFKRALKIFAIFLVCNFMLLLSSGHRRSLEAGYDLGGLLVLMLSGNSQGIFALNVLIPIGFTLLLSIPIMALFRTGKSKLVLLLLLIAAHCLSYQLGFADNYSVSLTLVGCVGTVLGSMARDVEWDAFLWKILSRTWLLPLSYALVAAYFIASGFLDERTYLLLSYHFLPTLLLMSSLYFSSLRFGLDRIRLIRFLNRTLGKNMLFAYLYHILIIVQLRGVLKQNGYALGETLRLSTSLLLFTVFSCHILNVLNEKSGFVSRAYSLVFK
jgi:hypothetical protein